MRDAAFDGQVGDRNPQTFFLFCRQVGRQHAENAICVLHRRPDGILVLERSGHDFDAGVLQGDRGRRPGIQYKCADRSLRFLQGSGDRSALTTGGAENENWMFVIGHWEPSR